MSASLVGSEMCIRDSPSRRPHSRSGQGSPRPRAPPRPGPCLGGTRAGAPVSYTHLTLPTICSV
eukprot:2366362-Alexandrium_andersonii.AAC.1